MKQTGKCPKCNSTHVLADITVLDRGHLNSEFEFSLTGYGRPKAMIFKERRSSPVSAWVCATCGFIEFYADNPLKLAKLD